MILRPGHTLHLPFQLQTVEDLQEETSITRNCHLKLQDLLIVSDDVEVPVSCLEVELVGVIRGPAHVKFNPDEKISSFIVQQDDLVTAEADEPVANTNIPDSQVEERVLMESLEVDDPVVSWSRQHPNNGRLLCVAEQLSVTDEMVAREFHTRNESEKIKVV